MATATKTKGANVAEVMRRFERGVEAALSSDGWRRYLDMQARFHRYSLHNTLLILQQRPGATQVAGYRTWQKLGRHVKCGEKGIAILAPVTIRKPVDEPTREDTEERDAQEIVTWFKVVYVFDVDQTEGEPLPEAPRPRILAGGGDVAKRLTQGLRELCTARGIEVRTGDPGRPSALGCWEPDARTITLREGLPVAQEAKTLAHELAHALMRHRGGVSLEERAEAEAAAEGAAYVVCTWAGLDCDAYSFDYVAGWSGRSDGLEVVKRVGGAIQLTAAAIIEALGVKEEAK